MGRGMVGDATDTPPPLARLGKKYEILYELGRGGMAAVYCAREHATGRERAIKIIHAKYLGDAEALARFARESRFVAQLTHPNIVPMHAVESIDGTAVALVMDCISGRTLKQVIRGGETLSFHWITRVLDDIAAALEYAHAQGIVHRDVKPENIFIEETTQRAILSDFGIARSLHTETSLTVMGMAIGTPTYMSPEQVDGTVDGRSDLYSLGLVGWEMLTGQRPWDGETLYQVIYRQKHDVLTPITTFRPDTPLRLLTAVEGLFEKDPGARWQTAADFRRQLRTDKPLRARRKTVVRATLATMLAPDRTVQFHRVSARWRQALRNRSRLIAGACILVAGAILIVSSTPGPPPRRSISRVIPNWHGSIAPSYATGTFTVAPGGMHTCLVTPNGAVYCWGDNGHGQIGDGGTAYAATPIRVASAARFLMVASSLSHTCALTPDGHGYCWGDNRYGQLGDGTQTMHDAPVAVLEPAPLRAIATGISHSCALSRSGEVWCWGRNDHGQLGDGSTTDHAAPVAVHAPERFTTVVAGWNHTCALGISGTAYCWGANSAGALGNSTVLDGVSPAPVWVSLHFVMLSAGSAQTCGVATSGSVYCWGDNRYGQLGDGTSTTQLMPVRVALNEPVTSIAVGAVHGCALTTGHRAWCWGRNNYGQLGDGTLDDRTIPRQVVGGHAFSTIATFGAHTCGTTLANEIFCWGDNLEGQLGDGTRAQSPRPVYIEKPSV